MSSFSTYMQLNCAAYAPFSTYMCSFSTLNVHLECVVLIFMHLIVQYMHLLAPSMCTFTTLLDLSAPTCALSTPSMCTYSTLLHLQCVVLALCLTLHVLFLHLSAPNLCTFYTFLHFNCALFTYKWTLNIHL